MLNQIITTFSSFNYVTTEEPAIKVQPQFVEKAAAEVKDGDKVLIAKDDMIIKFQIANNDEYFKIEKPEDIKLKAYHVKGKDEKEKYEVEEVEAAKALLKVFKEGHDVGVALNFQDILKYLEKDEKEIFEAIVNNKMELIVDKIIEDIKIVKLIGKILQKYIITKDYLEIFDLVEIKEGMSEKYSEDKILECISSHEETKANIEGIKLITEKDFKIEEDFKKDLESIQKDQVELKEAITNFEKITQNYNQTAINEFLPILKIYLIRINDEWIKILKNVLQTLQSLKFYKNLNDPKFGYAFQVTFKGAKDEKIIKNILTNFFIIKDKKLEEVKKDDLHFVDKVDDETDTDATDNNGGPNFNDEINNNDETNPNYEENFKDEEKPKDEENPKIQKRTTNQSTKKLGSMQSLEA